MIQENVLTPARDLESSAVVRFQDCDPFGHLNNARYIDYFMNARQDQLERAYGLRIFDPERRDTASWVVSKSQIAYIAPASLREEVLIRTRLIFFSETKLVVEGLMLDSSGERLKAVAWVEFTYVSLATGRPADHPESLMDLFGLVLVDGIFAEDGFNRRVSDVRAELRRLRQIEKAA
jgi:acyl-CoA thioester hydrolase